MQVTVEFTAQIKRAAGRSRDSVALPDGAAAEDLLRCLADSGDDVLRRHLVTGDGRAQPTLLLFRNDEQIRPTDPLHDGDLITLLSPISGG